MNREEVIWRLRRSTLELDILLHQFFHQQYDALTPEEQSCFASWLLLEDHEWQALLQTSHPLVKKIK